MHTSDFERNEMDMLASTSIFLKQNPDFFSHFQFYTLSVTYLRMNKNVYKVCD